MRKRQSKTTHPNNTKEAKQSLENDPEIKAAGNELVELLKPRYVVQEPLGKGGAGVVFRISDTASGIDRVAKILRETARVYPDISEEFKKEARRISALRHPNLVTVFEQSRDEETAPYFIMDLIEGKSLDKAVLDIVKKYPDGAWVKEVRKIAIQLADVLAYLHAQKPKPLLHLDIKPENIIVSYNYRNKPIPILLDFGISRDAVQQFTSPGETPLRGTYQMWPKSYTSQILRMTDPNRTLFSIRRSDINESLDLHLLGRTLEISMEIGLRDDSKLSDWQSLEISEFQFIRNVSERLDIDNAASAFDSSTELRETLKRVELPSSRTRYYFDAGGVKIPSCNVRNFGKQARALTDWPKFQRLHGIHQLGLTYLVYPGATHSRLEHSFGVFENALDVLDEISGPSVIFGFVLS